MSPEGDSKKGWKKRLVKLVIDVDKDMGQWKG